MSRRLLSVLGTTAILALAACGGSGGGSAAPSTEPSAAPASAAAPSVDPAAACSPSTDAPTVEVTIVDFAFPATIQAAVGDVVGFTNEDSAPHTATLDDGSCTTENLANGATGSLTFSAAGDYPFHCAIHPNMTGTVTVSG